MTTTTKKNATARDTDPSHSRTASPLDPPPHPCVDCGTHTHFRYNMIPVCGPCQDAMEAEQ